jgi:hypothetical protein
LKVFAHSLFCTYLWHQFLSKREMKSKITLPFLTLLILTVHFTIAQSVLKLGSRLIELTKQDHPANENIHFLVQGDTAKIRKLITNSGGIFKYSAGDIASVYAPFSSLNNILNNNDFIFADIPDTALVLLNDSMIINNGITKVHDGITPLNMGYDGEGVVIGIIDDGLDVTHPDFKDENGKSRIKFLWDRTKSGGTNPSGFYYGNEWTADQIDSNLCDHVPQHHGTHVAGIAAGNGFGLDKYAGVAPKADIIFVTLHSQYSFSNPVVDAFAYIFKKAKEMGKPCVINASFGYPFANHSGKDIYSRLIENLVTEQKGRAIACAAGNSGHIKAHVGYNLKNDTVFTWYKTNEDFLIIMMISTDTANARKINVSFGANAMDNYFNIGKTQFMKLNEVTPWESYVTDQGLNLGARMSFVQKYINQDKVDYYFYFTPDSFNYLFRLILTGSGRIDIHHYYNYPETGLVSSNLPDKSKFPEIIHYLYPDNTQTIMGGFACSKEIITVGNSVNRTCITDINGNFHQDPMQYSLYLTSSRGPTNDNRIKPEIIAAGTRIISCGALPLMPQTIINNPEKVAPGGLHLLSGGTSAASPVIAGIIALYLQKNPSANNNEIRDFLFQCADPLPGYKQGNEIGYGKVNAFNFLTHCDFTPDLEEATLFSELKIYPNPVSDNLSITFSKSSVNRIKIYNMLGSLMFSEEINLASTNFSLNTKKLSNGIYNVMLLGNNNEIMNKKVIVENK